MLITHRSYLIMIPTMHSVSAYNWTLEKLNSVPMMNARNSMYTAKNWSVLMNSHLGSKIKLDGKVTSEVKARIGKAAGSFNNLKKIWIQRTIPQSIKAKLYKACVRSVLLYGCESWPIKECDLKSLQSFEILCLRRCLHQGQDLPRELVSSVAKCDLILLTTRKTPNEMAGTCSTHETI